jgi:hypothetical protein
MPRIISLCKGIETWIKKVNIFLAESGLSVQQLAIKFEGRLDLDPATISFKE